MTGTEGAAGRLRDRVEVLELKSASADAPDQSEAGPAESRGEGVSSAGVKMPQAWDWETVRRTWAQAGLMTRPNVYSVHGIGAAGVSFILRRQPLTPDSALRWRGQHCLITAIRPLGRLYLAVDAALVVLSRCRNPATGERFPAVLTERYAGHRQEEPMALNTHRRVLVVPKAIRLAPGPLVEVDGMEWPILTHYELDPHKNEYTLERTVDL